MKCDLILPVWNQLEYTKACLSSLFATVDVPSRLIVIDNGSTDGTAAYLSQLKAPSLIKMDVVTNSANLGYGGAVNQGFKMSESPFVCVLNNDTVFGSGWLTAMIDITCRDSRIGIVNPESSTFGVRPDKNQSIEDLTKNLVPRRRDFEELGNCIGFCMLIKRDVIRQIGFFDDSFVTAFFEDSDFCMRAKRAGFLCAKACGAYVYHYEHKTVNTLSGKEQLFSENRLRYEQKWGRILRIFYPYLFKGKEALHDSLQELFFLARNECYVDVFFYQIRQEPIQDIFRYAGMRPHANVKVHLKQGSRVFMPSMVQIFKKWKKPYEVLLANDLDVAHSLSRMHWLHHLPIYMERAGVDDLGKCFHDCHVHVVDNFQRLIAKKKL